MQMQAGSKLAPADQIAGDREALTESLKAIQNFSPTTGLMA